MKQIDVPGNVENETEPTKQELEEIAKTEEADWSEEACESDEEEKMDPQSVPVVDSLKILFHDMSTYELLTLEETKKLGEICQAWQTTKKSLDKAEKQLEDAQKELEKGRASGNPERMIEAAQAAVKAAQERVDEKRQLLSCGLEQRGLNARNKLVEHNLRLVVKPAKKYHASNPKHSLGEFIAWGYSGLIQGAEKYDPEKKATFSTYVTHWIKKEIMRGQAEAEGLSVSDWDLFIAIKPIINEAKLNREGELESEEIALRKMKKQAARAIKKEKARKAKPDELPTDEEIRSDCDFPRLVKNIERLRNWRHADSLSSPVGEDGDTTWEDFLPSQSPDPLEEILESEPWKRLKTVFNERDIPVAEVFQTVFFLRRTETDKNGNVLPSRKFMEKYGESLRARYGEPYRRAYGRELLQSSKDVDEMIKQVYTILFTPENLNILKTLDPR